MGLRTVVRMPHSISSSGWPVTVAVADYTCLLYKILVPLLILVRANFGVWVLIKI